MNPLISVIAGMLVRKVVEPIGEVPAPTPKAKGRRGRTPVVVPVVVKRKPNWGRIVPLLATVAYIGLGLWTGSMDPQTALSTLMTIDLSSLIAN